MGIVSPEASSSVSSHPGSPGQSGEGGAEQGWGQKLQVLRRRRPRKRGQGVREVEEDGVEELERGGEWNELKGKGPSNSPGSPSIVVCPNNTMMPSYFFFKPLENLEFYSRYQGRHLGILFNLPTEPRWG